MENQHRPQRQQDHQQQHEKESHNKPQQAKRMEYFIKLTDKALLEATKSIDIQQAVIECYGDDVSIFGDSNGSGSVTKGCRNKNTKSPTTTTAADDDGDDDTTEKTSKGSDILANLVKETIEKVNEKIKQGILSVLEKDDVNNKMLTLEKIIADYEQYEITKRTNSEKDKKTTRELIESTPQLPHGLTPVELVNYHSYRLKLEERDSLLAEIMSIEAENGAIERQIEKGEGLLKRKLEEVDVRGERISEAANNCSFDGMG